MKIGNLYNLDSFQRFQDSGAAPGFADSDAGIVLARNLTAVDPKIYEKKYPELAFVNSGIQVDNSGGYARRIQSLRLVDEGDFRDSGDTAADKGKISLKAEDNFIKVFVKEANSKWTDDDIKEAAMQNINLPQRFMSAHTKKWQQLIDTIGLLGHGTQTGLLNNAGFTATAATASIATATAQEVYDDIAGLARAQWDGVYNTVEYMANRILMPSDVFNWVSATILNTAAGSSTVLKALRDNFPGVEFSASPKANSVSGVSKTVAFSTNEEAMKMRIPQPLTIGEIIKIGSFDFSVDSKGRIAGLDVLEALSGRYLTGL
jgi:hypothetical protein